MKIKIFRKGSSETTREITIPPLFSPVGGEKNPVLISFLRKEESGRRGGGAPFGGFIALLIYSVINPK
jgi:hypothetical protein